jgi:hypothetical protein
MVSCTGIKPIMTRPKYCTDLTDKQRERLTNLSSKPELNDKELKEVSILKEKVARFNDSELSESAKKYLLRRFSWEKYNMGTIPSEQKLCVVKGNDLEAEAVEIIRQMDKVQYERPSDFINNGYIFGKCDIFGGGSRKVVDIKVSWSIHNFIDNHISKLNEKHWWQMQGYMELYNMDFAEVKIVLLNTPHHLLEKERGRTEERYLLGEIDREKFDEQMENLDLCYDYSKISKKRKVITYKMKRDRDAMQLVYRKIGKCRLWLSEFDSIHMTNRKIVSLKEDYAITAKEDYAESDPSDTR